RAGSREQRLIEERRRRFELWLGHGVASEARLDAIELTGDSIEQLARRGRRAASGGATRQRVTEESLIATVDGAVERFLFCRRCAHEHVARADGRDDRARLGLTAVKLDARVTRHRTRANVERTRRRARVARVEHDDD